MQPTKVAFYYLMEFESEIPEIPQLSLTSGFPGLSSAVAGSNEYETYEEAITKCVEFLKAKLVSLNAESEKYKIYWTKNQFDELDPMWEETELAKIYIASDSQDGYNGPFRARVFFIKTEEQRAFHFAAPSTLQ
jgi:hypothetical protein